MCPRQPASCRPGRRAVRCVGLLFLVASQLVATGAWAHVLPGRPHTVVAAVLLAAGAVIVLRDVRLRYHRHERSRRT